MLPPPGEFDRVAVVYGPEYDHRNRKRTPVVVVEDAPEAVQALWATVTDWEPDSPRDSVWMEPVLVTLAFLSGRAAATAVGLKSRSATSDLWDGWDRHLRTSDIYDWLRARGVDPWAS